MTFYEYLAEQPERAKRWELLTAELKRAGYNLRPSDGDFFANNFSSAPHHLALDEWEVLITGEDAESIYEFIDGRKFATTGGIMRMLDEYI